MPIPQMEALWASNPNLDLADGQPEEFAPLVEHLAANIAAKTAALEAEGHSIEVLGPEWSRANPVEAGRLHAKAILATYSNTYALPNKDPLANQAAVESGELDLYFMAVDGKVTGTTCLVDVGGGRAELGRSASAGGSGNTIIQDMRILDWLTRQEVSDKYHTLFTTLRNAPDRVIEGDDSECFVMRGGQAITGHWKKFPGLMVSGVAPLYLKHGALEQFTCASLSRNRLDPTRPLYVEDETAARFVGDWHKFYGLPQPQVGEGSGQASPLAFEAHYPPAESGLTGLVHADVVASAGERSRGLTDCLSEVEVAGSPFTQIVMPIDRDTRALQAALLESGYQVYGYQPADELSSASLMFGKVRPGTPVVPTHWSEAGNVSPFWPDEGLHGLAEAVASQW